MSNLSKLKVRLSTSKKFAFIFFSESLLKLMIIGFYFILKLFSFLRYSNFCPDFFGHLGKRLDKKAKINFKIYNAADWTTNNYNTHIAQYLKK